MIFMGTLCLILWKCSKNVGKTEYNTVQNKQDNQTSMFWKKLTEVLNISRKWSK